MTVSRPSSGGGGLHAGSGSLYHRRAPLFPQRCPPHPGSRLLQDPGLRGYPHPAHCLAAQGRPQRKGHLLLQGQTRQLLGTTTTEFLRTTGLEIMCLSAGHRRAATLPGRRQLLRHQRRGGHRPAGVRPEGSVQVRQPGLHREDPHRLQRPVHSAGRKHSAVETAI